MKVRSKELWDYLEQSGALDSPELIPEAKTAFRKIYKKNWRKDAKRSKELHPSFTRIEFEQIGLRAKLFGLRPTTYARNLILSAQQELALVPNKQHLLEIQQCIGMAENAILKDMDIAEASRLLLRAEEMLAHYLNQSSVA